jgi:hypothetical protein
MRIAKENEKTVSGLAMRNQKTVSSAWTKQLTKTFQQGPSNKVILELG